jgi:hypothetical protein
MTTDQIAYNKNISSFINEIKQSFVMYVGFNLDTNPTFDNKTIPFDFKYCHSITIATNKEIFNIQTSMADGGIETFWITPSTDLQKHTNFIDINSKVHNVSCENGIDNYAFKISIAFENSKLIIYSGEIYDTANGELEYKINDEMILVFTSDQDAAKFEKLTNYR